MSTIADLLSDPELLEAEWDLDPLVGGQGPEGVDRELEESMRVVTRVVEMGRALRERAGLKIRQPLRAIHIRSSHEHSLELLRMLRARRGLTRKATAAAAGVSERYLANLEQGIGNPSMLILAQLASALRCAIAEVTGDVTTSSPEWLLIREASMARNLHALLPLVQEFGTNRIAFCTDDRDPEDIA